MPFVLLIIFGTILLNYIIMGSSVFIICLMLPLSRCASDWVGNHLSLMSWIGSLILTLLEYRFVYNFIMERIG